MGCAGFVAIGDMATALSKANSVAGMEECLEQVAAQIKEAIAPASKGRSRSYSPEALNVRMGHKMNHVQSDVKPLLGCCASP